ncbi:pitrilysin family protein [Marivivens sp. LCG002]|uniref:M16 family metallopeptidase n=1 Tax=Marivivens sp. LCG002 TaxID=3051171 RepID=UPI0033346ECD
MKLVRFIWAMVLSVTGTAALAAIEIQEITTPSGIDLWLVEEHSIPFVALDIHFDGGSSLDLEGKRGATNLMMGLIEEGAGELDAQAFQAARESLAASFSFSAYDDGASVSAKFLTENQDDAVALLTLALTKPRFDQEAIDRVKGQVIAGIASDAKNPNRIAGDWFYSAAFGDHPYGSDQSGTVESVTALSRDDILEAHRNALVKTRAKVSVVGDITPDAAAELVDRILADLPESGPELIGDVGFGLEGGITVIDYDTPQAVALFGHKGIKREDEDFFAAFILNSILGGSGRQSVLMDEVREKRGLTYGVYTYLVAKDHAEMILGSVASANERIAEAIDVIKAEWARIAADGITQEQLDEAKTYLTGEYPLRFDGNAEISSIMIGLQVQGLEPSYVVNRNDYINAVTLEDINRVAAELLDPDALHFTVVGKPVGLETAQ